MTLIAAASWFLVNAVWPGIYRTSLPDGYETDGVYAVSLNRLSEGQNGYRPEMDTPEQRSVDFHRIGNALREMPEVQDAAPVGATLPGLNYSNYNRAIMVDTVNRYGYSYAYHRPPDLSVQHLPGIRLAHIRCNSSRESGKGQGVPGFRDVCRSRYRGSR